MWVKGGEGEDPWLVRDVRSAPAICKSEDWWRCPVIILSDKNLR